MITDRATMDVKYVLARLAAGAIEDVPLKDDPSMAAVGIRVCLEYPQPTVIISPDSMR